MDGTSKKSYSHYGAVLRKAIPMRSVAAHYSATDRAGFDGGDGTLQALHYFVWCPLPYGTT